MEKLPITNIRKGLLTMDIQEYVEFLCLSCGLQGLHAHERGVESEVDDCCPKCGDKLLTISRPQPNIIGQTV